MNETALITGASSGIGLELARVFARNGYDLLITARRKQRLLELKYELEGTYNNRVKCFVTDLSEPDAPRQLHKYAVACDLPVTVLVNNAGIGDYGFFHESDWDKTATMIDLNMRSITHLTRLFLPDLINHKRAYVMNVASTAAFQPGPLMSVYYASKHYVLAFSEAIANELANTGVTVTTLCPGPTESEFQERADMKKSKLLDRAPMATSKDVAEYGFKAMKRGKRVAIYGISNTLTPFFMRLLPRNLVTSAVRRIQERKP